MTAPDARNTPDARPAPRGAAWRSALAGLLLGAAGMATVVFGVPDAWLDRLMPKGDAPLATGLAVAVTAPFTAIFVHELGHLLAGLLQGFRFELFVVGPLGLRRDGTRIRLYLNTDAGMMGGIAATSPTTTDVDLPRAFGRILIAGPLASVILAIGAGALFFVAGPTFAPFVGFSALASLGIFAATTIPARTGLFFTDRKRWQRLRSAGPDARVEQALLLMVTRSSVDGHHRDLSPTDIAMLRRDREPFIRFLGDAFAYLRARDLGDTSETAASAAALEAHRDAVPKSVFQAMGLPAAAVASPNSTS